MDRNEELMEIFQNENFKREVDALTASGSTSADDLREIISNYGLDLTTDEVISLCSQIATYSETGEMSDRDLENVSGGGFLFVAGCVVLGVACIGSFAIGVYNGYRGND